jgi:hypothetical protein
MSVCELSDDLGALSPTAAGCTANVEYLYFGSGYTIENRVGQARSDRDGNARLVCLRPSSGLLPNDRARSINRATTRDAAF